VIDISDPDNLKKYIGVATASFAAIGGAYTAIDGTGVFNKPILEWAPEYFNISNGPADGEFRVVVARKKYRDCAVEKFTLEVKDADFVVHKAKPSVASFSGPATKEIDKFAYKITIENPKSVAPGKATLLAHIDYKCPDGAQMVNYPNHPNLTFNIEAAK
jgi:hypothetical protein